MVAQLNSADWGIATDKTMRVAIDEEVIIEFIKKHWLLFFREYPIRQTCWFYIWFLYICNLSIENKIWICGFQGIPWMKQFNPLVSAVCTETKLIFTRITWSTFSITIVIDIKGFFTMEHKMIIYFIWYFFNAYCLTNYFLKYL